MHSKGKPPMTAIQRKYVRKLAELPCVVCGAHGVEIHEFKQGAWFSSVPVCPECHRGQDGWHHTRQRWSLNRVDMVEAIDRAVGGVFRSFIT